MNVVNIWNRFYECRDVTSVGALGVFTPMNSGFRLKVEGEG